MLTRANQLETAVHGGTGLPHSVDSRFGLYHVAVMLSFLRSPVLQKFESFKYEFRLKTASVQGALEALSSVEWPGNVKWRATGGPCYKF